ncbi:toxin-antitoxin system, toxin component, GNAT domain protein [Cardiobacterium valvarum F0432]|uniref:Toxin-antitoxin system, toxin component, GNAT domain protein n=1 Tax=Cardiobacterium valvarum F0432 TaxID=797473 RepID=G9ZJB3_9GAMM|nr:toxin-antitoxin system, toxin component, GNAT domain protein [Cardiobacterium valvarum F0432]
MVITLASASIPLTALPETLRRKLPRYPSVPAILMGRLAADLHVQGQSFGSSLLADALFVHSCYTSIISPVCTAWIVLSEVKYESAIGR